ncbi:MAG: hypothetical protein HZA31_08660 [Opitutae bacterium]|nr:hypothetical protein [Opitutae bacterium]
METQPIIAHKRFSFAWILDALLGKITRDPLEQRNFFWHSIAYVGLFGANSLCLTELLNTYLAKCGFTNQQLGTIAMYPFLANSLGMFLWTGLVDKIQRRLRAIAISGIMMTVQPLGIIALLLLYPTQQPHPAILYGVIALNVIFNLIQSMSWMLDMSIFVRCIREQTRGRAWGIMGVIAGLMNVIVVTQIARWAHAQYAPNIALILCMTVGVGLWVARAIAYLKHQELPDLSVPGASQSVNPFAALKVVFRIKECRALVYPQILRGATSAMAAFIIPFVVKHMPTPDTFGSYLAMMAQAGLILGSLLVALLRDRMGSGLVVFIGDTMVGLGFGLLFVTHNWMFALPVYALVAIGNNVEGSAVPLGTFSIIPAQIMGAFSGIRAAVTAVAAALASRYGGQLLDVVNPLTVFGFVAGLKVVNGIWFWFVFEHYKPVVLPAEKPAAT